MLKTRTDQRLSVVRVDPPRLLSDYSLITSATLVGPGQPSYLIARVSTVQRRCWKRFDVDAFTADLLESDLVVSPPVDVSELFNCYNTTLTRLVNLHTPVVTVTSYSPPTAPWFDRDCHLAKVKTRRLEKMFRSKQDWALERHWREQLQRPRRLYSEKYASYWTSKIDSCDNDNSMLWFRLRCLLQPANSAELEHSAEDFACQFAYKVTIIRASIANALPPVITDRPVTERLTQFNPVTPEKVATVLKNAPAKQRSLDPVPSWFVKKLSTVFASVIANL